MSAMGEVVPVCSVCVAQVHVRAATHPRLHSGAEGHGTGVQCGHGVVFCKVGMNTRCGVVAHVVQARGFMVMVACQIMHFGSFAKAFLQ